MKFKSILVYGLLILLCLYSFHIINEDITSNPDKYTEIPTMSELKQTFMVLFFVGVIVIIINSCLIVNIRGGI